MLAMIRRSFSNRSWTSSNLRQSFIDYFKDLNHVVVESSSVMSPPEDASLLFVNAGMNQFKSVFLGKSRPPYTRIVNHQKCIRLNDLSLVGHGHHLTFFEMLGTWSFGDYYKKQTCEYAWNFLTQVLCLDPRLLHVSYFAGGGLASSLGLEADLETRDIWKSLGVPDSHIIAGTSADNFWSSGANGAPCGISTEIHVDMGASNLMEVWNLVFMQYYMSNAESSLDLLPKRCIDTGMGLERLLSVLGHMNSDCYDTDLFVPLMNYISRRMSDKPQFGECPKLDVAYKILADHARMLTVCMSDGIFPDSNHRLRNIVRRTIRILKYDFDTNQDLAVIMTDLCRVVVDILGEAYPEMTQSETLLRIEAILVFEIDLMDRQEHSASKYRSKLQRDFPSFDISAIEIGSLGQFYEALRILDKRLGVHQKKLDGELALYLYDTLGLYEEDIIKLVKHKGDGLTFDVQDFHNALATAKRSSKLNSQNIKLFLDKENEFLKNPTVTTPVYSYQRLNQQHYQFPVIHATIVKIISCASNCVQNQISSSDNEEFIIFLDKTSFYGRAGGQNGDRGSLELVTDAILRSSNNQRSSVVLFKVSDTFVYEKHWIGHVGRVDSSSGSLRVGDIVEARIDISHRLCLMQNHTATHILNYVLHGLIPATSQRSSQVRADYFQFDFNDFRSSFDPSHDVDVIETRVNEIIDQGGPVFSTTSSSMKEDGMLKISIPGLKYPQNSRFICMDNQRVFEPCCGTHVLDVGDVGPFVIVDYKLNSGGQPIHSVQCITGQKAVEARKTGTKVLDKLEALNNKAQECPETPHLTLELIEKLRHSELNRKVSLPYVIRTEALRILDDLQSEFIITKRQNRRTEMLNELKMTPDTSYIVHFFAFQKQGQCSSQNRSAKDLTDGLSKVTKSLRKHLLLSQDIPIMLMDCMFGPSILVAAKATVPPAYVDHNFNAIKWIEYAINSVNSKQIDFVSLGTPKGQDKNLFCRAKFKVQDINLLEYIRESLVHAAKSFANDFYEHRSNFN